MCIRDRYWVPKKAFANLTESDNFLHHFLASQQPGTIDTSLVSTDHINNPNTINAIFEIPARLERAKQNPPEYQGIANLLIPSVEDGISGTNPRHTPRVLLDGADSIGVFGALSRVYLNIGTFAEEWSRCHNPIIGFKPQRPFSIATCDANSVYWRTAEKYRIKYLKAFFALNGGRPPNVPSSTLSPDAPSQVPVQNESTAPMKLIFAGPEGKKIIEEEKDKALAGRTVFLRNCAICHSSKQPENFQLTFSPKWSNEDTASAANEVSLHLTLPMSFTDWELFKKTRAYQEYVRRIVALAGQPGQNDDLFTKDNYLSTDIRVPITCLLYTSPSPRDLSTSRMPSSA